jgi:hypothetical protein
MRKEIYNLKPNTDIAYVPSAYRINSIKLTNHAGLTEDIVDIIIDFKITESIYNPSLVAQFSIKDMANFMEDYELIGAEIIDVNISRTDFDTEQQTIVDLRFRVVEYPLFGRGQQNTQVYKITAITEHGYFSKLRSISRAIKKDLVSEIRSIITDDLGVSNFEVNGNIVNSFRGIIPYMSPIDAAAFILRRSFDANKGPVFLYQTLLGTVKLATYDHLVTQDNYYEYFDDMAYKEKPKTPEEFTERRQRILSLASPFRMSKIIPAAMGAFAASIEFLDLAVKTNTTEIYSYKKDPPQTLTGNKLLSSKDSIDYSAEFDGAKHYVPTSAAAWGDGIDSYSETMKLTWAVANSVIQNMEYAVHDIRLNGDMRFNAGKKIKLNVPKAVDGKSIEDTDKNDDIISGSYIIASVVHTFGEEYYIDAKIKRDSLTAPLQL